MKQSEPGRRGFVLCSAFVALGIIELVAGSILVCKSAWSKKQVEEYLPNQEILVGSCMAPLIEPMAQHKWFSLGSNGRDAVDEATTTYPLGGLRDNPHHPLSPHSYLI